eukprot:357067-Chlamydomonas_euryale.AAC.2
MDSQLPLFTSTMDSQLPLFTSTKVTVASTVTFFWGGHECGAISVGQPAASVFGEPGMQWLLAHPTLIDQSTSSPPFATCGAVHASWPGACSANAHTKARTASPLCLPPRPPLLLYLPAG